MNNQNSINNDLDVLEEGAPDPILMDLEALERWIETEQNPRRKGFLQGVLHARICISVGLGRSV